MSATRSDVVIAGGGIIGLASAWRLSQHGLGVTVVDPAPARAASHAAAGMLAPVSEVGYGEQDQLRLSTESLRRYPAFVTEIESVTGREVGLRRDGTVIVATDAGDRERLVELHAFQESLGLSARLLSSRECRDLEPMLSPDVRCGLLAASDHSIDNRRLAAALLACCEAAGVTIVRQRVVAVNLSGGGASGVRLDDGRTIDVRTVVIAAGPWSAAIAGLTDDITPRVRPVKGQILRLRATPHAPLPSRSLRGLVNGHEIYLVPRADGELVVGATVEEAGFDTTVRAGAVRELLRDARAIMPVIDELELAECSAALRPGSPDNLPSVGTAGVAGVIVATGHHRNGILLAPVTADLVATLVTGTVAPADAELLDLVSPQRFQPAAVSS